jgi:DNA-binding MurR/RpiR family transcriptional regulator
MAEDIRAAKQYVDLAARIRGGMAAFPRAEKRVARFVLSGPPTVALASSAKLAREAHVSGPTVVRFANRLGFATYADFQQALRQEIDARATSPVSLYTRRAAESSGPSGEVAEAIIGATAQTLRELPADEFWTACRMIGVEASHVIAFGGWYSRVHAEYLVALLQEVRSNVRFVDNSPPERVGALVDVGRRDVAVSFDFRRYEEATTELASGLHARGARVILITDRWLSPAAAFADVVLPAVVDGPSAFDTLVPAIAIAELIVSGASELLGDSGRDRFEKFASASGELARRWGAGESLSAAGTRSGDEQHGNG